MFTPWMQNHMTLSHQTIEPTNIHSKSMQTAGGRAPDGQQLRLFTESQISRRRKPVLPYLIPPGRTVDVMRANGACFLCVEVGLLGHDTGIWTLAQGVSLHHGHLSCLITYRLQQDQPLFLLHFTEQMNLTDGRVTRTPRHQPDYAENKTIEQSQGIITRGGDGDFKAHSPTLTRRPRTMPRRTRWNCTCEIEQQEWV